MEEAVHFMADREEKRLGCRNTPRRKLSCSVIRVSNWREQPDAGQRMRLNWDPLVYGIYHAKAMADSGDPPSSLPHESHTWSSFSQFFLSEAPLGASALIGRQAKAVQNEEKSQALLGWRLLSPCCHGLKTELRM